MAPRRSARIVGVMRKETRVTEEDDQVSVEESAVSVRAVAVEKSNTTPPKTLRVVPVEESRKQTREEKAEEDGVEQTRTQEAATEAEAEAEGEQKQEKMRKKASETGAAKKAEQKGEKKIRKKKMKRRGRGGGGDGYRRYVFRVLKQVHPELRVSSMAMAVLNGFMNDMFERIVGEAAQLSKYSGRMTLSAKEIQGAVRLVLPGELGKHAVAEGMKAVTNYYGAVIVKPPS